MPLLHCKKCHHEWEGRSGDKCDWCGSESFILEEQTPLEKFLSDKENLARFVDELKKEIMDDSLIAVSKFLSLVLRHHPERIGLTLDSQGWADIVELLELANQQGKNIDRKILEQVVAQNDKQRFLISPDGTKIRANQGHSFKVDLGLELRTPPVHLYHGTAAKFLESIRKVGLLSRRRQYVHLSLDKTTALSVGRRHGKAVVLIVLAGRMHHDGYTFYLSANGIWLTERVPAQYLNFDLVP